MKVGVLALQGDFREHIKAATECGHLAMEARRTSIAKWKYDVLQNYLK